MSLVTVTEDDWTEDRPLPPWHPTGGEWTVAELAQIPDSDLRHELYDGILVVSPAATPMHQRVVRNLTVLLLAGCPAHLEVLFAPLDFQPTHKRSFQPDVLVCRRDAIGQKNVTVPPVLIVEVASPSTRRFDQILKREMYRAAGVGSYWIVDPEPVTVEAMDLVDGAYRTVAKAAGPDRVRLELPFAVEVCPAELVTG